MSIRCMVVLSMALLTGAAAAQDTSVFKTQKEKQSYALGMNLGNQVKARGLDVDIDQLVLGFKAILSGSKPLLTEQEAAAVITELLNEVAKKLAEKNKSEGEAFLAANQAKEGIVTLPSGLQYKILQAGQGNKPGPSDAVICNYRGTFIDGREFDSSYKNNQPARLQVNGVIKGMAEALQLMPVGSRWQIFIPSSLAYGEKGRPDVIGPNATLIFELELISIVSK